MLLMIPVNMLVSVKVKKWQGAQMKLKDERQKMTNEVLNGIKVIKLYAWEEPMLKVIYEIRRKEVALIKKANVLKAFTDVINITTPFIVAITSFIIYLLTSPEHQMTPQIAFVSLTLFSNLRHPLLMIGELIGLTVQTMISNKRLKSFLVQEELNPEAIERDSNPNCKSLFFYFFNITILDKDAIDVQTASFTWDSDDLKPALKSIDLSVEKGSLIAIVSLILC